MKNNSIDIDYKNEYLSEGLTTNDYVNIQNKYADIWKAELDFVVNNLMHRLSEDDKSELLRLQQNWEDEVNDMFKFERMLLTNEEYKM